MKKVKVLVYGRVQGIGFRYWVRGKYKKLGIEGEVWNNEDGTVGAEFSAKGGSASGREAEKKMMEYLKKGPPLARVDKVDILN